MGRYETSFWSSDASAPTLADRMSGTYHPFVPNTLSDSELTLTAEAASACERAATALAKLDARAQYTSTAETLSRMLLRSEAISSSRIEGLEMSARRLLELEALEELGVPHRVDSSEAEILGSIRSMRDGIDTVAKLKRVSLEDVLSMHEALLRDTRLSAYGGVLRTSQNWIGGSWYNPLGAAYIPPTAERVPELMEDLVSFVNDAALPGVATAAIAHAQLETIHPFADGNGRCGRALIHVILKRRELLTKTVVPVSLVLLTMREQYVAALAAYRSDEEQGGSPTFSQAASGWIEFFCFALEEACARATSFEEGVATIRESWQARVKPRGGSAAELLLDALPGSPVVSIESAARLINRSYAAARNAVRTLEERGVLAQRSRNKKSGLYIAQDIVDELTRYERALATASGDTGIEHPQRPVPQRAR